MSDAHCTRVMYLDGYVLAPCCFVCSKRRSVHSLQRDSLIKEDVNFTYCILLYGLILISS